MSFITVQHSNPGKVTKRLEGWSEIFRSNLILKTVIKGLDKRYDDIYRAAPERTGRLRQSIYIYNDDDSAEMGVGVYYGIYVDQGRSPRGRRVPNPFWSNNIAGLSMQLIVDVRDLFASRW
jgi:hypothetical protein